MTNMFSKLILVIVAALLAACATSPTPSGSATAPSIPFDRKTLNVGVAPSYPPVIFKTHGKLAGIEIDLAKEAEAMLGTRMNFVELDWNELFAALADGRVDVIMAGVSITPEREKTMAFVTPYLRVGQMALIREGDVGRLASYADARALGRRVGVESNTTGEKFVKENFPDAHIIPYANVDAAVSALQAGELDYVVHDAPTIWHLTLNPSNQQTGLVALYKFLTDEQLAWAVRLGDTQAQQALSAAMDAMLRAGTVRRIVNGWIQTRAVVGEQRDMEVRPATN